MRVPAPREWTIVGIDTMAATEQSTRANTALDDLYRRHVGDVYRYTYAVLGNHADAEDVTQTTFVNALRALERGEYPRNPSSWLLAIAHNLVRQRWRQAAARPTEIELVGDVAAGTPDDEIELDDLVKALQRIPPAQREALVMRELEGRPYVEIAELLGITNSALETLLFRARRSLADELENLVTCQTAELALSQGLDGRLSRKERRRLKDHLGECASCRRLADMQGKQRRAFKGLALLPLPVGLTLFKGAPAATAAIGVPTIGVGATGLAATSGAGVGAAGVGAAGAVTATTAGAGAAGRGRRRRRWLGGRRRRRQGRGGRRRCNRCHGRRVQGRRGGHRQACEQAARGLDTRSCGGNPRNQERRERGAREPRGAARVAREGARRRRGAGSPQAGRGAGPTTWADGCSSQGAQRRGLESRGALGPRLRERPGESALPDECSQGAWHADVAEASRQVAARPA